MAGGSDLSVAAPKGRADHLYLQVLVAIALGAAIGHFFPAFGETLKPLGDGFIRLVKMVIGPVIFLTVTTGIAHLKDMRQLGGLALKAFSYFAVVSSFALLLGLIVANTVQPGAGMHVDPASLNAQVVAEYAAKSHDQTLTGFVLNIIPTTFVSAFVDGEILQVLLISILFGVALASTGRKRRACAGVVGIRQRRFLSPRHHFNEGGAAGRVRALSPSRSANMASILLPVWRCWWPRFT